jgi:hypothetical protein
MIGKARKTIATGMRIALLTAVFVGPVGAFAMANANTGGGISGAGLVLYVTLQRAG